MQGMNTRARRKIHDATGNWNPQMDHHHLPGQPVGLGEPDQLDSRVVYGGYTTALVVAAATRIVYPG